MIHSFKDAAARQCFEGIRVHRVGWEQVAKVVRRKLLMVDAAEVLDELRAPPNNRLEALSGDRAGQHSIRVNDQWRVCFVWSAGRAQQVEIVDDHRRRMLHGD